MDVSGALDLLVDLMGLHLETPIGPDDDFFEWGGDSLTALAVVADAGDRGLALTVEDLVDHPTARALAARADELGPPVLAGVGAGPAAEPGRLALMSALDGVAVPRGVADVVPASSLQVGMAYQCARTGDPELYHDLAELDVRGPYDAGALRQAVAAVCARHEALRTTLDLGSYSCAAQVVWETVALPLSTEVAPDATAAAAARDRWRRSQLAAGIDVSVPPPFRVHVVTAPGGFGVTLAFHHAVVDGWSYAVVALDLMVAYDALLAGREPGWPPAVGATRTHLQLERAARADATSAAFWQEAAAPDPLLVAPGPGFRAVDASRRIETAIPAAAVAGLRLAAREAGVPLKSLALGLHAGALRRATGRDRDLVTGLVTNGRPERPGVERAVGLFLNTVPLRFPTVAGPWAERARQAFSLEHRALPHRRHPLAAVEEALGRPAFDVAFNFTDFHVLAGLRDLERIEVAARRTFDKTSVPLMVDVAIGTDGDGELRCAFDPALVDEAVVTATAAALAEELDEVATSSGSTREPLRKAT